MTREEGQAKLSQVVDKVCGKKAACIFLIALGELVNRNPRVVVDVDENGQEVTASQFWDKLVGTAQTEGLNLYDPPELEEDSPTCSPA